MEPSLDYEKETLQKFLSFFPEPKAKKPNSGVIIFGPIKLFLFDINLILREKVISNEYECSSQTYFKILERVFFSQNSKNPYL